MKKIAIIGAGLSGALLSHFLKDKAEITIFEKSRGVGGRMSTRYADPYYFNHGVSLFKIIDKLFKNFLQPYFDKNIITPFNEKSVELFNSPPKESLLTLQDYYTISPRMNLLCKDIISSNVLKANVEISKVVVGQDKQWSLYDKNQAYLGNFDWVVSTAPLPQTKALLGNYIDVPMGDYSPCHVLMLGASAKWKKDWSLAFLKDSTIIEKISVSPTEKNTGFTIYTKAEWSINHLEIDKENLIDSIVDEFEIYINDVNSFEYQSIHRWRYANAQTEKTVFCDKVQSLAFVADGTHGIETVWQNMQELLLEIEL